MTARVLITRPSGSDRRLPRMLEHAGARILWHPTIEIDEGVCTDRLDDALRHLERFHWIVFTSAHAVRVFAGRMRMLAIDRGRISTCRIAAVGPSTARMLSNHGLAVDVVGMPHSAEGLIGALRPLLNAGSAVLYPRANKVAPLLAAGLRAAGASVVEVVAYRTRAVSPEELQAVVDEGVDCVVFCSPSEVAAMVQHKPRLAAAAVACIGPTTARAARDAGFPVQITPAAATAPDLARAIVQYFAGSVS